MLKNSKYQLIIEQHKNNIYGYALYMLKNKMDADDVTQEVMIRIWKNIGKFKMSSAKAWIMKTTRNLCLDYLRKRKLTNQREYDVNEEFQYKIPGDETVNDPEIKARQEFLKLKIKESIENLPENLKSAFVMYEMYGMKYKEISDVLEIPLNSVRVYLLRARRKLQNELREYRHEAAV